MNIDNFATPNRNQYVLKRYGSNIAVTFAKTQFRADGIDYNLTDGNVGVNIDPPLLITGKITNIGNVGNAGNVSDYQGKLFYYYTQNTQTQGQEPYYPPPTSGDYWMYNGYGGATVIPAQTGQFIAGTGDFTFEFFLQQNPNTPMNNMAQFGFGNPSVGVKNWVIIDENGAPLKLSFTNIEGFGSLPLCLDNSVFDNFTHVAIVRKNGVLKSFCNGVFISMNDSPTATADFDNNFPFTIAIASGSQGAEPSPSTCIFSNVRYVVGSALYDSNFDIPSVPLQIVNGSGTRLLINNFGATDNSLWGATISGDASNYGVAPVSAVDNPYS